ncbi:HAMP domain-containing sensor histidine kinase [Ferrimicrobium sp.]|uniref:HAMP domain-containing sensor histidine kinase n=1 Tax=Ferrimicrobium sp. TaxID=2926050 RepID=UPI00262D6ED3|nr:HAMP domain-containing sensor histidine kinase [Ferrimicrobium sp.]
MKLRLRLALVLAAFATAAGLVVATLSYTTTSHQLMASVDASLRSTATTLRAPAIIVARRGSSVQLRARLTHHRPGGLFALAIAEAITRSGKVIPLTGAPPLPVTNRDRAIARGLSPRWLRTQRVAGVTYRILTIQYRKSGALLIGRNIDDVLHSLAVLRTRFLLLVLGTAVLAAIAGSFIATALSRPILALANTLTTSDSPDLSRAVERSDEVGVLARSFRDTLERLRQSEGAQRRLVQNASHELRTPLTSLRTNIDLLQRYETLDVFDRERILADLKSEAVELTSLLDELVTLSIEGHPAATSDDDTVDLCTIVPAMIARFEARTQRSFEMTVPAGPISLRIKQQAIERVISNLLDNAIKFSPPNTTIAVTLTPTSLEVTNVADPLDENDQAHLFERFYRAPSARAVQGSGLGLAIVHEIITAIGGTTYARNNPSELGNRVAVGFTFEPCS